MRCRGRTCGGWARWRSARTRTGAAPVDIAGAREAMASRMDAWRWGRGRGVWLRRPTTSDLERAGGTGRGAVGNDAVSVAEGDSPARKRLNSSLGETVASSCDTPRGGGGGGGAPVVVERRFFSPSLRDRAASPKKIRTMRVTRSSAAARQGARRFMVRRRARGPAAGASAYLVSRLSCGSPAMDLRMDVSASIFWRR